MAIVAQRKLHWTQRVALVRHNLHTASRTRDFGFFKALQANAFLEGTDYVGTLNATLGDEADTVQSTLDNLNAGIAYVHQDAFKNVYDAAKRAVVADLSPTERAAQVHVDALQQKQKADNAIDRMTNSATSLIQTQPAMAQEAVANVWISGTTIIADVVEVCIKSIKGAERCGDGFIQLEDLSSTVTTAVEAGISALKGIFNLLETDNPFDPRDQRTKEGYGRSVFRRLSTALSSSSGTPLTSRSPSTVSVSNDLNGQLHLHIPPSKIRASSSASVPSTFHSPVSQLARSLPTIPPTPDDRPVDPLDTSRTLVNHGPSPLSQGVEEGAEPGGEAGGEAGANNDMYTPGVFRRLSGAFWPEQDKPPTAKVVLHENSADSQEAPNVKVERERYDSCASSLETISNLSVDDGKPLPMGGCKDDDYNRGISHRLATALATENHQATPQVAG